MTVLLILGVGGYFVLRSKGLIGGVQVVRRGIGEVSVV
jgi:hypothetical protein